jgi:hypothetical protein
MACFRKCPDNEKAYICYQILQTDSTGREYIQPYLFCSNECLVFFKHNHTFEDDNGYERFNEIVEEKYPRCPVVMQERVIAYKKIMDLKKKKQGVFAVDNGETFLI